MTPASDTARPPFIMFAGLLLAIGTIMVCSTSITSRRIEADQVFFWKQLSFGGVALLCGGTAGLLPPRWIHRFAPALFLGTLVLLVAVLVPGVGITVNGAQRWLRIGDFTLQPSETAKLTLPLFLCWLRYSDEANSHIPTWKSGLGYLSLIIITAALVASEPDLGTAGFVSIAGLLALFLSGWPLKHFIACGVLVVPAALALFALKPYQMARIQGFLDTWQDPDRAPYQVQQSLTTLGVGGWTGAGLGKGWQKLSFLPEANTDFIFAVIGEELGVVGTLGVIGLWGCLFVCGRRLLTGLPRDSFAYVASATLLVELILQAAVNIAVVTALVPPKGISHPFISYGGSNLVISVTAIGLIVSLSRFEKTRVPSPCEQKQSLAKDGVRT